MIILAIDDEPILLEMLTDCIREASPTSEVYGFDNPRAMLNYVRKNICDVAFLDIHLGGMNGVDLAKQLKLMQPAINLIFVTGYSEYMQTAFALRASGYLLKPATPEKVAAELENLRNPPVSQSQRLKVRCFGTFDAFVDNAPLHFERTKTKELLAYLVDRHGASVNSGEICAVLWEEDDLRQKSYLRTLMSDLAQTLESHGLRDVLRKHRNSFSVDPSKFACDYYDYLENRTEGIRAYNGEYMSQYSWGEETLAVLAQELWKE